MEERRRFLEEEPWLEDAEQYEQRLIAEHSEDVKEMRLGERVERLERITLEIQAMIDRKVMMDNKVW